VDPIQRLGDADSDNAECYLRSTGAFKGSQCLELLLQGDKGRTTWTLPSLSSTGTSHFRFAYRKTNPKSLVSVRLKFADGSELLATEGQLGEVTGWSLPVRSEPGWHDVVLSFADLKRPTAAARIPAGKVESFTLEGANGEAGDAIFFDAVEFLRNPCHPVHPENKVLVAGRTEPARDKVTIVLETGGKKITTVTKNGCFFFPVEVKKGSIVKVYAVPEDKAARYSQYGRYFEVYKNEVELLINLEDARDARLHKTLEKIYKFVTESSPEAGQIYKPRSLFVASGLGTTQEFANALQISNQGFLDRDRRFANPDRARRLLFLGNCNLFGHSVPRAFHANTVLEGALAQRLGYRFEVVCLANSSVNFGKYRPYFEAFGKNYGAEVVCIFLQSGCEMVECNPDLFAKFYEYDVAHLPCQLFRSEPDGKLTVLEADPEYFRHVGKDPALKSKREQEKQKGSWYMDGVDWLNVYYRTNPSEIPENAQVALEHFKRVLKFYRDEFRKHGARLVLVISPEYQMSCRNQKEFKDLDGYACKWDCFPKRMEALCRALQVGFVDSTTYMAEHFPHPEMCSWRFDSHPSAYGFEWMGEGLAEYLIQTNFLRNLPGSDPLELEQLALDPP